jgi:hypothetical protein
MINVFALSVVNPGFEPLTSHTNFIISKTAN